MENTSMTKALELLELQLRKLNATKMGRRSLIKAAPLLLAGCAVKPTSNRHREGDNSGQKAISVSEEIKMTKEYLPQMKKDYPTLNNRTSQYYIEELGQKIVRANKLAGNPYNYSFEIVQSKHVNAFALPAGKVFVTTPLLAMADSEAELAGVIGHEIGHIQARHTAERIALAKEQESQNILYGVGGLLLGGIGGYGLGKLLCKPKDKECLEKAAKYGAMAGGMGALLIQKYAFMANSQEDEMEADRIGFKTSLAAGYHKDYIGRFYNKLYAMEKKHSQGQSSMLKAFSDALSTHPPSEKRVKQMQQMAQAAKNTKAKVSSRQFDEVRKIAKGA